MSKIEIAPLTSGYRAAQKLDQVLQEIEVALDNTLSRDGQEPNAMGATLDMDDNRIVNVGAPVDATDAVRLMDIASIDPSEVITWNSVIGKPSSFTPSPHTHTISDITNFQEGVEDVVAGQIVAGTNVTASYDDLSGKLTISASGGGGGGGPPDWTDITNKPTTFTPSAHTQAFSTITDGQEAVEDIVASQIIGGTNVSTSYNDTTGKLTINATGGGGGGSSGIHDFSDIFGGVGDGVTNNDSAFDAAEASSYEQIYLPQGRFYTSKPQSFFDKRYWGPGKIFRGSGGVSLPQFGRYKVDVHPVVDPLIEYGLSENIEFGDVEYRVINSGTRKNLDRYLQQVGNPNGYSTYFWAPSTPHFLRFVNQGGWSGFSGLTTGAITSGVTTSVGIAGGTSGWQIGDTVGFTNAMDGLPTDTRTLTSVSGGNISWSGALSNSYPAGTTITHGYRTMNSGYVTVVDHSGGGDAYVHVGIMNVNYTALASQTAFEQRATGGLFGGSIILSQDGNYGTGWENQADDTNHDTCYAGFVNSYSRKNNTGGYGNFWIHDLAKMDGGGTGYGAYGLKPLDGIYVAALGARTGLDFSRSSFTTGMGVALALETKVAFDATINAPGPSNGNGWVATTDNSMYIKGTTVSGTKVLELNNGSYRLRLQANGGLTTNAQFTIGNNILASGYIQAPTLVAANSGGTSIVQLGAAGNTYLSFDGSTIRLFKNGSQVDSW